MGWAYHDAPARDPTRPRVPYQGTMRQCRASKARFLGGFARRPSVRSTWLPHASRRILTHDPERPFKSPRRSGMDTDRGTTDFWLQPAEHDWRPRPTLSGRDHTSLEV